MGLNVVRNYVKKNAGPSYNIEDLKNAVIDVSNSNLTYRQAAERYGVPISVICSRIKWRKVDEGKMGAGRPPQFSPEVESCLVKCLKARARIGYPCDKQKLKQLVQEYIITNGFESRFKDGLPGDDWYQSFMKRNPCLKLKKPEHLQKSRKDARNPFVIYDFFLIKSRVTDFVEIFSKNITNKCSKPVTLSPVKGAGSRLKSHTYGEVLTADEVLGRLKEVENAKLAKRKKTAKTVSKKKVRKHPKMCSNSKVEEDSDSDMDDLERETEETRREESDAAELEDFLQEMESKEYEEVSYIAPSATNIIPNNYIVVDILGGSRKTTHFSYVCKVDNITDDDVEVTGLKSVDAAKTKFVLVEKDCFSVGKDQVKAILPAPSVKKEGRSFVYKFPSSVNVKEK